MFLSPEPVGHRIVLKLYYKAQSADKSLRRSSRHSSRLGQSRPGISAGRQNGGSRPAVTRVARALPQLRRRRIVDHPSRNSSLELPLKLNCGLSIVSSDPISVLRPRATQNSPRPTSPLSHQPSAACHITGLAKAGDRFSRSELHGSRAVC